MSRTEDWLFSFELTLANLAAEWHFGFAERMPREKWKRSYSMTDRFDLIYADFGVSEELAITDGDPKRMAALMFRQVQIAITRQEEGPEYISQLGASIRRIDAAKRRAGIPPQSPEAFFRSLRRTEVT